MVDSRRSTVEQVDKSKKRQRRKGNWPNSVVQKPTKQHWQIAMLLVKTHLTWIMDMLIDKGKRVNAIQEKKDQLTNMSAVHILLDVARTLARQGLAFRGSSTHDHGETDGNFYQITQLLSRHCPCPKSWLSEAQLRPYHVAYIGTHRC